MHLEAHNKYRKLHDVPPVVWSGKLQRDAYKWAAVNQKDNKMYHSTKQQRGNTGENLAAAGTQDPERKEFKEMIETTLATDLWYDEVKDYDWKTHEPKPGTVTGHFT